jgi:Flp pilus assembly pilin Flp
VRQRAQGLVEYALLLVFIAVVAVVAVASLGTGVVSLYSRATFAF